MGKLTKDVFNESCCDGGAYANAMSAQPCGCDLGAKWVCRFHQETPKELMDAAKDDLYRALGVKNCIEALIEIDRLQEIEAMWHLSK